jgi:hypothetical protein
MAKFTLNIETDDAGELRDIVSRIADAAVALTPVAEAPEYHGTVVAAPVVEPVKPKAAPKAEKPKPAPEADPTPAPATLPTVEEATAAAAATVQAQPAAPASDVSYDAVKQALIQLMDKKSASVVQGLLKDKFGVVAISQLDKARYGEALVCLTDWAND